VVWARNSGFTDVEEAGAQEVMGNSKAKWDSAYDNDVKRRRVAAMQAKTMALAASEAGRLGLHLNPSWGCQPSLDSHDLPSETDSDDPPSEETRSRLAAVERGAHGGAQRDKRSARRELTQAELEELANQRRKRRRSVGGGEHTPVGQQRRRDHQREESEQPPAWRQSPPARGVGGGEHTPVGQQRRRDHQREESEQPPAWRQSPPARGVGGDERHWVTEAEAMLMSPAGLKAAYTQLHGGVTTSGNNAWLRNKVQQGKVTPRAPRAVIEHGRLDLLTAAAEEQEAASEAETSVGTRSGSWLSSASNSCNTT
jgi:hypothetical protein